MALRADTLGTLYLLNSTRPHSSATPLRAPPPANYCDQERKLGTRNNFSGAETMISAIALNTEACKVATCNIDNKGSRDTCTIRGRFTALRN
jgi:hypothetical protein